MLRSIASYLGRNCLALIALVVALGGTSYAAVQLSPDSVGSNHIRSGAVRTADLGSGAVTLQKINRNARRALRARPGPAGPQGAVGPAGPKGDTGAVDTSGFYTKGESDGRFLGLTATAADADLLDGLDSGAFMRGSGSVRGLHGTVPSADVAILDVGGVRVIATCGLSASVLQFGNLSGATAEIVDQASGVAASVGDGGSVLIDTANGGETAHTVLQVAWGAALDRVTTFALSVHRPASGCPARAWGTAITND